MIYRMKWSLLHNKTRIMRFKISTINHRGPLFVGSLANTITRVTNAKCRRRFFFGEEENHRIRNQLTLNDSRPTSRQTHARPSRHGWRRKLFLRDTKLNSSSWRSRDFTVRRWLFLVLTIFIGPDVGGSCRFHQRILLQIDKLAVKLQLRFTALTRKATSESPLYGH